MASVRRGLKRHARAIGFFLGAVLLGTLVRTSTVSAQCSPLGPETANNTACGTMTLEHNTTGTYDSAFGANVLVSNTTGFSNTASGAFALFRNTTGSLNTASGALALGSNTTGDENTASGYNALGFNSTGHENTASGYNALVSNTTGEENTASGAFALFRSTTGKGNIGLGFNAGTNIAAGSNNIEIGGAGSGDESDTIRIGTSGTQKKTFIAGISGTTITGADVVISSTGQLGVATSSARYKRDIRDMGGASTGLMKLRPVTFRYKSDPAGTMQYGLVAEEVERVYPELVTRGPDGKVQSVRYLEFTALLLNELQKQGNQIAAQQREIKALKQKDASINALSERLAALEQQVRTATPQRLGSLASK
jgi:Chaperone of endosialidase